MDQIIRMVAEKVGISPEMARAVVTKILGFLKTRLPESATSQLNAALGGTLDSVPPTSDDLVDEVGQTGLPVDKVPGTLEAVIEGIKDKLPEGIRDDVVKALTPGGGLLSKISGWLTGNKT
jgi:hypothetical protein